MRTFVGNHKKLTAVIGFGALLVALIEVWSVIAPMRGRLAARFDLRRGHYRILTYGLPPSWLPEYARLLEVRYGVELHPVAGCIVSKALVSYVDNYDDVVVAAENHKIGRDVFKECAEVARKTAPIPDKMPESAREQFLEGNFAIITNVQDLPSSVLQTLTVSSGSLMANPGGKFEPSDVIDSGVPRMRLIFAGVGNGKSFVHYEQGGRGHMFILAFFRLTSPSEAQLTWRGYCDAPARSLADLRCEAMNCKCQ